VPPGSKKNITFNFNIDKIPMDFYLLVDISGSMGRDLATIKRVIPQIISFLQGKSSDVNFGLGTFVDKNDPQGKWFFKRSVEVDPMRKVNSFRNVLKLSSDVSAFEDELDELKIASDKTNVLYPESQLEALAQVMVCPEVIGWRGTSRKIILLMTDADYHMQGAMPSKDVSPITLIPSPFVNKPFDGKCHVGVNGLSDAESTQDYPSENHIVDAVRARNVHVMFGKRDKNITMYTNLASKLSPRSIAVQLLAGSLNIVQAVADLTSTFLKTIELQVSPVPPGGENLKITYFSNCGGSNFIPTKVCNLSSDDVKSVTFVVEVSSLCKEPTKQSFLPFKYSLSGQPGSVNITFKNFC